VRALPSARRAEYPPASPEESMPSTFEQEVATLMAPHLPESLSERATAELARFCSLLREANERLNLTRLVEPRDMALLHVVDSLTALPLLRDCHSLADLGSGGGVPGVPLALARPDLRVTLLESRGRKAEALAGIVEALGLQRRVAVVPERGETWLKTHKVDAVVARAVGRTPEVLQLLSPVRPGFRRLILMKGPGVDAELAELNARWVGALGFGLPRRVDVALPDGERRVLLQFRVR
jgi:16S rRNA (guanine527-N7)-methyltransferase